MEPQAGPSREKEILSPRKKRCKTAMTVNEKTMIMNCYKYVFNNWPEDQYRTLADCANKVVEILGVSETTVRRVVREHKQKKQFTSPKKTGPKITVLDKIDEFDFAAIRRIVHQFFHRNEAPTIQKILQVINDSPDLPNQSATSLRLILKQLNFKYASRKRRSCLIDRDDIRNWRKRYLLKIKQYRQEGRPIYYQDETWVNEDQKPKTHDIRVPTQEDWQLAAARKYVHTVLSNSTLMPFRWRGNRYICFYCYQTFHDASSLRTHTRGSHKSVAIMKHLTQNRTSEFAPIKVDIGEPLTCLNCKHQELTLEGLIAHLKEHKLLVSTEQECFLPFKLADNQISCQKCAKSYQFFGMLYSHMNKVHLEGTKRICEACGQNFFSDFSLRKHVQVHHQSAEFKCKQCEVSFKLDSNRISHEFKEHNIKTFKCYKCNEMFGSQYLRRLHMNGTHHKADFTCTECSKPFLHKSLLTRHVNRVHLKEKKYSCLICQEAFFDLPTLNLHTKKHSKTAQTVSLQCKVCMRIYSNKIELDDHMTTHSGQSLSTK